MGKEAGGGHLGELGGGALGDLGNAEGGKLVAELLELVEEIRAGLTLELVGLNWGEGEINC